MKHFKVALIGCGFIADTHMLAWNSIKEAKVTCVCDIDNKSAERIAKKYGVERVYTDYNELFEKEQVDIADITTPGKGRIAIILKAASKKVHILCEKPSAESIDEMKKIAEVRKKEKIKFMVNQTFRFYPISQKIKTIIDSGKLGRIFYANISQRIPCTVPEKTGDEPLVYRQKYCKDVDQLIIFEMCTHYLDLLRYYFGNPISIYATAMNVSPYCKGEDITSIILNHKDLIGVIENSWCSKGDSYYGRIRIEGTRGTLELRGEGGGELILKTDDGDESSYLDPKGFFIQGFIGAYRHFIDSIVQNHEPITNASDNLKSLELVLGAYESVQTNNVVTFS